MVVSRPPRKRCARLRFRQLDGRCTTNRNRAWGAINEPQFSYRTWHSSATPTGTHLPSARLISNIVSSQSGDILSRRRLNQLTTFMGQFLDHCLIKTPSNRAEPLNIPIPRHDRIFANFSRGQLSMHRSRRMPVRNARGRIRAHRAINTLPSAVDLTAVYGTDERRLSAMRTGAGGMLRVQRSASGDLLPLNTGSFQNDPANAGPFFLAGESRSNENPALTSLHTLFVREHNTIARQLHAVFPGKDDDTLFQYARVVNIAQFQKVVFEEYYPAMTGRTLRYRGYNENVNPTVSDIFGGAAFRVGHTMVGSSVPRRGPGNKKLAPIPASRMFFPPAAMLRSQGIDPFLRGMLYERSQEVDLSVSDTLRNLLFSTRLGHEHGFDLVALNIQRGRDHALPSYNGVRRMFGRRPAGSFHDISRSAAVRSALHSAYGSTSRVEAWVGLMAEPHVRGA